MILVTKTSDQTRRVCVCVCIKLDITAQFGPGILVIATRIGPPKGESVCVCVGVCLWVCVYFIKLHMTAQSGPVILVILYTTRIGPPKGGSMIRITKISD